MNVDVRIEITGALLKQGPQIVQKHVEAFVDEATAFLLREVQVRTPQGVSGASGLLGSIQMDVKGRGQQVVRGVVDTASPYGEIIERGRRPGKMPPKNGSLREWVQLKFGVSGRDLDRAEFLVRRKIAQKGFDGKAMFYRALNDNLSTLEGMAQARGLNLSMELGGE